MAIIGRVDSTARMANDGEIFDKASESDALSTCQKMTATIENPISQDPMARIVDLFRPGGSDFSVAQSEPL
jgi:hypothetical protein